MAVATPVTIVGPAGSTVRAGRFAPGTAGILSGAADMDGEAVAGTISAVAQSADWLARSTAPGVVWAHGFDYDAEVSAHLKYTGPEYAARSIVEPHRVIDESGIGCVQQVMIGAAFAAPFTAGSATIEIDDDLHWPDPAVRGPYWVMAAKKYPDVGTSKNLFRVTAKNGKTLTIVYEPQVYSPFVATAQSYSVGDYIGNEDVHQWIRVFSALPAGENGLPVDDRADGGAVPVRSKSATGTYGVPRDLSYWNYGYYGHPTNITLWENWTGWDNQGSGPIPLTPRGPQNGAAAKYRVWDGSEFWVQFRVKIDPRFWQYHQQPVIAAVGGTNYWTRKAWAIIKEVSTYDEMVTTFGPSNFFNIPGTNESVFSIGTNKAQKILGASDVTRTHPSPQYGSPWHVAPYWADTTSGTLPASGAPTPDGAGAWEYKSGEWITFLVRVKPGRSDTAETEIEIKFARTESRDYDGTYTTLLSITDGKVIYSASGDYTYPAGAFTSADVVRMDALPGYQALWLFGYLNIWQTADLPPPKRSYYYRMAQVIFSRQPIAAPAPDFPTWVPATQGEAARHTAGGGVLTNNFRDTIAPWMSAFYDVALVNDYSGAVAFDGLGSHGSVVFIGGGHAGTNSNQVTTLKTTKTGMSFARLSDPTAWSGSRATDSATQSTNSTTDITSLIDAQWLDALPSVSPTEKAPPGIHSYQSIIALPDGGNRGSCLSPFVGAAGVINANTALGSLGGAHRFNINSDTDPTANKWTRAGSLPGFSTLGWQGPLLACLVTTQRRVYYLYNGEGNPKVRWLDLDSGQHVVGSGSGFVTSDYNTGLLFYIPGREMLLYVYRSGSATVGIQWMDVSAAQPTLGGTAALSQTLALDPFAVGKTSAWVAAFWCPHSNRLNVGGVMVSGAFDNAMYEIEVPSNFASAWPVTRRPITGSAAIDWGVWTWQQPIYLPQARAAILFQHANRASEGADSVIVYRPHGT